MSACSALPNAGKKLLRSLAEITGGSGDLELLPDAIGKDFYLGADRRFVVGNPLHRNQQGVIPVAALVAQEQGISVRLGDDQIGSAVAIHIGGDQGARLHQLYLVELHLAPSHPQSPPAPGCAARATPVHAPFRPRPPGRAIHRCRDRSRSVPNAAVTFCTGKGTRSKRLPCTLRHSEMPGLPAWVRATSIHPSLLKSSTTAPTVGDKAGLGKERRRLELSLARVGKERGRLRRNRSPADRPRDRC